MLMGWMRRGREESLDRGGCFGLIQRMGGFALMALAGSVDGFVLMALAGVLDGFALMAPAGLVEKWL